MTLGTNGYEMWLGDNLTTWNAKVLDANNSSLNLSNTNITIDGPVVVGISLEIPFRDI